MTEKKYYHIERIEINLQSISKKLNKLFNDAAEIITTFRKIGKPSGYKDSPIKIVKDYLLVYKEFVTLISILTIWDASQNPLELKKILE